MNIIELDNIAFRYERGNVIENITLHVPKGAFLGLVGPNGSGKSTLLKCLLGILTPKEGNIRLFGKDIATFHEWYKIGYVSQKANSFNSGFPATVFEVVAMGLTTKLGLFRFLKKKDKEKVMEVIEAVGMTEFAHQNIGELSGGQQQRAFIARALVSEPELLILDEPTVGVDASNSENFYEMLENLNKIYGITLVLVTHDIGTVSDKVTHVACLNRCLHFHGDRDTFNQLSEQEFSAIYGYNVHRLDHHHDHSHCQGGVQAK